MKLKTPQPQTHACQARARPACIWHAVPGTDLCRPCLKAEQAGEHVPRIARPVWDGEGRRVSYPGSATELVQRLRGVIQHPANAEARDLDEIPF